MDATHSESEGQITDISVLDQAKTARITFANNGETYSDYETNTFSFSQLLKFTSLRKSDLKDEEGEVISGAGSEIMDELEGEKLTFKFNDRQILGVVSTDYVSIPTQEAVDMVRETITRMGVSDFEINHRTHTPKLVEEVDFVFGEDYQKNVASAGDTLQGGIQLRNSVFGASSLRANHFYTILACTNGMVVNRSQKDARHVHMGDSQELREWLVDNVEEMVEHIWETTDLIEDLSYIEFPIEDQIRLLEDLAENRKITKSAASVMATAIIAESGYDAEDLEIEAFEINGDIPGETFNTGDETIWGFLNAFTGYATHSELSSHSTLRQLERTYNQILQAEDREALEALAE